MGIKGAHHMTCKKNIQNNWGTQITQQWKRKAIWKLAKELKRHFSLSKVLYIHKWMQNKIIEGCYLMPVGIDFYEKIG